MLQNSSFSGSLNNKNKKGLPEDKGDGLHFNVLFHHCVIQDAISYELNIQS